MVTKSKAAGIAFAAAAAATWGLAMVGAFETGAAASELKVVAQTPAKEAAAPDCTKQAWPYVARECLAAADGTPVRQVSRTIAIVAR